MFPTQVGGAEGIVNGMDLEEWDPARDKYLTVPYDEKSVIEVGAAPARSGTLFWGVCQGPTQVRVCVCGGGGG
jgi:granule-bound starch synthase